MYVHFRGLYTKARFVNMRVYLPTFDPLFFNAASNINTGVLFDDEDEKSTLTHTSSANWCTDAVSVATLHPRFSC